MFTDECVWENWGNWQACSKSCGYGLQTRTRNRPVKIQNGENTRCDGKAKERRGCNKQNCDGSSKLFIYFTSYVPAKLYLSDKFH